MKRMYLATILTVCLLFNQSFLIEAAQDNYKSWSADRIVEEINKEISDIHGITTFYPLSNLNKIQIEKEIKQYGYLVNPIPYGKSGTDKMQSGTGEWGKASFNHIGADKYGQYIKDWKNNKDQFVRFTAGWSGYKYNGEFWNKSIPGRKLISYNNTNLINWLRNNGKTTHINVAYNKTRYITLRDGSIFDQEEAIKLGIDEVWNAVKGYQLDNRNYSPFADRRNAVIHNAKERPIDGSLWFDNLRIIIPPTYFSWGLGIRYSKDPEYNIYYGTDIPIAPFAMLENDISVHFDPLISGASEGEQIIVPITVESDFSNTVEPTYKWRITKRTSGEVVSGVTYITDKGQSQSQTGSISVRAKSENVLYAVFKMPNDDIDVEFIVNENKGIQESDYNNNSIKSSPLGINLVEKYNVSDRQYDLTHNVLSKKVKFDLGKTPSNQKDIMAKLPSVLSWKSNATGTLNVFNQTADLFRWFWVDNNPYVNEASTTIIRKPIINATIERADFGDNPVARQFLNLGNPWEPVLRQGAINTSGNVSRRYTYYCSAENCSGHTGTASAPFNKVNDVTTFNTYVYNGMKNLPFVKQFDVYSNGTGINNPLAWKGTAYSFDVIRWMCHLDENDSPYSWQPIGGQYQRTFIGQSNGSVVWNVSKSMAQGYAPDRQNAASRRIGANNYAQAVFATDKQLQSLPYPIKSGYYFNPIGTYTCTVKTSQYKDTPNNTSEHQELVDKVKASFRYNSDLTYTKSGKDTYQLKNVSQSDPQDVFKIANTFNKNTSSLKTTTDSADWTDKLFCEVMEGYDESKTMGSKNNFKYKEYVKDKTIYLVEETTVITFTIAQSGKLYTFLRMKNGDYGINVWSEGFTHNGSRLAVKKADNLDNITVSVRGSMYDDQQ